MYSGKIAVPPGGGGIVKPTIFLASNKVSHISNIFAVLLFLFNHIQSTLKL
jgi:hypothetical protein